MPTKLQSSDDIDSGSDHAASVAEWSDEDVTHGPFPKRRRLSGSTSDDYDASSPGDGIAVRTSMPAQPLSRVARSKDERAPIISKPIVLNGKTVDSTASFASLGVAPWLLASLAALEVKRPTAIQKACIPAILAGRDVIGGSRTGSGKTIAFTVPLLQTWSNDPAGIFGVVLTPTRELALQIFEQIKAISAPQSLKPLLVVGGGDMMAQALQLAQRPHVVIATPGRLADLITTLGTSDAAISGLGRVRVVVLDEADRLLAHQEGQRGSMIDDVEVCLDALPPSAKRQTCLFTATMTAEVLALRDLSIAAAAAAQAKSSTSTKKEILVCEVDSGQDLAVPSTLKQSYIQVPVSFREAYLHVLLGLPSSGGATSEEDGNPSAAARLIIVFCNRTATADLLERLLRNLDHRVTSLHSRLAQRDRSGNLARFRAGAARILVASDVASRGLDIPHVDMVINYDVPRNPDDYIHRVGRTARAGREGEAITFVGQRDVATLLAIEKRVGTKMQSWAVDGVNLDTRVARDALKQVGEIRRRVELDVEDDRDILGRRKRGKISRVE